MPQMDVRRPRRRKKKKQTVPPVIYLIAVALAALLILLCIAVSVAARKDDEVQPAPSESDVPSLASEVAETLPAGDWTKLELLPEELSEGDLVLVNVEHGIDDSITPVTVFDQKTDSYYVKDATLSVDKRIMQPLNEWMDAFEKATGLNNVNVVAGYRTKEYQRKLYDNAVATKGTSHAEAYIQVPGYSEHHTGLAIDFDTYFPATGASGGFDGTGQYAWIEEHAWQYGFIRRYPENKAQITGISYEPWHFRYVGVPHAYEMQQEKLCLEEYIDLVREHPFTGDHLYVDCAGSHYEIYFCTQNAVFVPTGSLYTVSGNNVDGYIVTVTAA